MVIQCENCQKKYKIDPTKLKSNKVAFACKQCGNKVIISTADPSTAPEEMDKAETKDISIPGPTPATETEDKIGPNATMTLESNPVSDTPAASAHISEPKSKRRYGINAKMLLLFFFIPLCLVITASAIYMWQLESLSGKISSDSYTIVERLSKELVNDTATMVANQCKLYLDANPYLTREDLNRNAEFRNLALKTVGETGYTCIYSVPDRNGKSGVWVHPNERIVGIDLPPAMKKALGPKYQAWFDIYKGAYHGKSSTGYYKWQEKDGSIRDKYMTCVPVKGTPYVVAATTYVDEIKRDVDDLKVTANGMKKKTTKTILIVLGFTMVLMGSTTLFYSRRLKTNLSAIIDAAEKISVGELETVVKVNSDDEISDLAEAISRMQESIRLSIERLRRRR
jgi:nitrogen fixation/metabolism regulation signal transduction histidine kinase/DNA-directed RNA polymerase subunit RPC12/RpoP